MRVTKIGAGFVGLVPGASFADFGHYVPPCSQSNAEQKNSPKLLVPGLYVLNECLNFNPSFENDVLKHYEDRQCHGRRLYH